MKTQSLSPTRRLMLALAFSTAIGITGAQAQNFSVVYNFSGGNDGANPLNGLILDGVGNMYGTASAGGASNNGVVFKLTSSGETALYSFNGGSDGASPQGALVVDMGTLYGTTFNGGGPSNAGTVYAVTTAGVEQVIYSFAAGSDGANPQAGLAKDAAGNLYGTTSAGGAAGNGTVFKLTRPKKTGEPWIEQVLYSFGAAPDGATPVAGVAFDAVGNLYGTTSAGGSYGFGTIFQLVPSGSSWSENILHEFQNADDGAVPYAGLVFNKKTGNFYGAATEGGVGGAGGTLFELTPSGSSWNFNVLYALPGSGISGSFRDVLVASPTTLYATTHCDGQNNAGTVYKLSFKNGVWNYDQLYTFTGGGDGLYSFSNLLLSQGYLYGTTKYGGTSGNGVIFKVKP